MPAKARCWSEPHPAAAVPLHTGEELTEILRSLYKILKGVGDLL